MSVRDDQIKAMVDHAVGLIKDSITSTTTMMAVRAAIKAKILSFSAAIILQLLGTQQQPHNAAAASSTTFDSDERRNLAYPTAQRYYDAPVRTPRS